VPRAALALTVLLLAAPGRAAPPAQDELAPAVDAAVKKGLAFLARSQSKDGSWTQYPDNPGHPAISGLSVMAFLSAGHVPGEGPYGRVVERGVRAVLKMQNRNGLFAHDSGHEMYHHGICTLMLAEVVGMTQGPLAAEVKKALEKAVGIILVAQRKQNTPNRGGWRYNVAGDDSDMSVTGWQVMALRAAKNVGCDVPPEAINMALAYVKRSRDAETGGYGYTPGGGVTVPCTGTAILCMAVCGQKVRDLPETQKAGAYLLRFPPDDPRAEGTFSHGSYFFYASYYCAQATFQLGGNYWAAYRPRLFRALLKRQKKDGGWEDPGGHGTSYATAMAVLSMAVEHRFLPIYQRGEEP
jgi:hypothetical protein